MSKNVVEKKAAILAAMDAIHRANQFDLSESEKSALVYHMFGTETRSTWIDGTVRPQRQYSRVNGA